MTRSRLEPHRRREQLLDTGAALFASRPYDDVFMEDLALRAGVSRATLYHYFPNKRSIYVAIFRRASNRFQELVSPDPQRSLNDQIAGALDAHIQYFLDHPFEAVTISRGTSSDDPEIRAIIAEELNGVGQNLVDQLVSEGCRRDAAEIAVEGWLAFVRATCTKWVNAQNISRNDLTTMCVRAFGSTVGMPASGTMASPRRSSRYRSDSFVVKLAHHFRTW